MAKHHKLPSLPSLSTSGMGLSQILDPAKLRDLGWAAAGGTVGAVAGGFVVEQTMKLPLIDKVPGWGHYALVGTVGSLVADRWNSQFACGLAGHMVGGMGVGGLINGLLGRSAVGALPEEESLSQVPGAPGDEDLAQLPSPDVTPEDVQTDVVVDESDLAGVGEIEPSQQFRGGFGASVEEVKPLGSWLQ